MLIVHISELGTFLCLKITLNPIPIFFIQIRYQVLHPNISLIKYLGNNFKVSTVWVVPLVINEMKLLTKALWTTGNSSIISRGICCCFMVIKYGDLCRDFNNYLSTKFLLLLSIIELFCSSLEYTISFHYWN